MFGRKKNLEANPEVEVFTPLEPEVDPNISFPARPPIEVLRDGIYRENEPGAADDIEGRVLRFGIIDQGQVFSLSLEDIRNLVTEYKANQLDRVHAILDRTRIPDDLVSQIRPRQTVEKDTDEAADVDGFRPPTVKELKPESEELDRKLEERGVRADEFPDFSGDPAGLEGISQPSEGTD